MDGRSMNASIGNRRHLVPEDHGSLVLPRAGGFIYTVINEP
jgi:hypothetical protein